MQMEMEMKMRMNINWECDWAQWYKSQLKVKLCTPEILLCWNTYLRMSTKCAHVYECVWGVEIQKS